MTDGIIQEVFKSIRKEYIFPLTHDDMDFIELELIEKIKQKRVWQWDAIRLRDLIGDNQE